MYFTIGQIVAYSVFILLTILPFIKRIRKEARKSNESEDLLYFTAYAMIDDIINYIYYDENDESSDKNNYVDIMEDDTYISLVFKLSIISIIFTLINIVISLVTILLWPLILIVIAAAISLYPVIDNKNRTN